MSTSAGAGGYETPNAFGELGDDTIEMLGYKKVKKVKKEVKKPVKESEFMKLSKELYLNEISYNEYRKDPIASPKAKINNSINYINRGLKEIEKVVSAQINDIRNEQSNVNSRIENEMKQLKKTMAENQAETSRKLEELKAIMS
jgi:hypothetical protein